MDKRVVSTRDVVGGGYDEFWRSRKRYVVCKGSRASKKSCTAALKIITRMMEKPLSNTLVVRKTQATLKDSCFAQLKWAIDRLGVGAWWKSRVSPLEIEYIPTGQKILFRGLDEELKTTSITVSKGIICFGWVEEAYEIEESAFDTLDEGLRGIMPDGYYIQWLITFNPWDSGCWLKSRFFDFPDDDTLAMTTNYQCNEWLSDADRRKFEKMKRTDPERYRVAGEGEWGVAEGQFFKCWKSSLHVVDPFDIPSGWIRFRSMDWGSARPYCVQWWAVDYDGNLWCYRELYGWGGKPNVGTGETAKQVAEHIIDAEPSSETIYNGVLDNACWAKTGVTGPSISEELNNTLYEARRTIFDKCSKGRVEGANALKQRLIGNEMDDGGYKPAIYFFSTCIHTIRTIPMLAHDKSNPETYDTKAEDHACDTAVYACLSRPWTPIIPQKHKQRDKYAHKEPVSAWTY